MNYIKQKNLKGLREGAFVSLVEFSLFTGLSTRTIQNIELDKDVSTKTIRLYLKHLRKLTGKKYALIISE